MHVMSPVQQASLEYGKAYIQQIESHLHPFDQHVVYYITIITNIFGKLNSFLQTYVIS